MMQESFLAMTSLQLYSKDGVMTRRCRFLDGSAPRLQYPDPVFLKLLLSAAVCTYPLDNLYSGFR